MNKKLVFYETFTLTPGSFDRYSNITPYAILDVFQEAASKHAHELNMTYNKQNSDFIWLLLRSKYEVIKEITRPIKIKIKTWPLDSTRVYYDREYLVYDLEDNLLIKGTSLWCIFDMKTNMISRSKIEFPGIYLEQRNYDHSLKKIPLQNLSEDDFKYKFIVSPSHLDINNHMNNAKYSIVLIDALNLKQNEIIQSVEINYLKELVLDDKISIYTKLIDNSYYCYGYKNNDLCFSAKVSI